MLYSQESRNALGHEQFYDFGVPENGCPRGGNGNGGSGTLLENCLKGSGCCLWVETFAN